jgi:DNA-binding response OmpR family regulator
MSEADLSRFKILIIEDDEFLRAALAKLMGRTGGVVLEAGNGVEGLRLFRAEKPALVITDILMPDKEGLETIREMRRERADVRIIAISAGSPKYNLQFLDLAEKFGADATMHKPVDPDMLLVVARRLLSPGESRLSN